MPITVNTNVMSLNSQRALSHSNGALQNSIARLSSGLRVNTAKDDAAGLAISERMTAQIRGINQGVRNAADGISLAQTAEGALGSITDAVQRMRELAIQSANATNSTADRASLQQEYSALGSEITRIASQTEFNGLAIIGANSGTQAFQVGAEAGQTISVTTSAVSGLGGYAAVSTASIGGVAAASSAIAVLDTFLNSLNSSRANLGAIQSRLEIAVGSLAGTSENTTAARGRIIDADFAKETATLTKNQILVQAGTAMLSQANAIPQNALSLLRR